MTVRRSRWAPALLALLVGGCASLRPEPPAAAASADAAATPAPAAVRVEVRAERSLRKLLESHLDLARLGELASPDALDATEWDRLVRAAPSQARGLLETEGYFDAEVRVTRAPAPAPGQAELVRIEVDAGPRATVRRVDVEIQGPLERAATAGDAGAQATIDRLRADWELPAGQPFRNPRWADAKASFLAQLRAAGYASATWSGTAADVDVERCSVRLFAVADSGPLFRSGVLLIEGLERHDAATVQHLAGFGVGTAVTENLLLDFNDRLRQSGLFDGISVSFDPDPALAAAVPIRVQLKESVRQIWTVGIGISANTGPRASLEHLDRRPFGLAATARNKLEIGRLRQAWDGELSSHPLEKQYRNLVGGAFERLESDDDLVQSLRARVGRARNSTPVDRLMFVEVERSSRRNLSAVHTLPDSQETAVSANYHGTWRRVDDKILPTEGLILALQGGLGLANGTPGERGLFGRAFGRLVGYHRLGSTWYGQARIEFGQVFRPDRVPVPDSQQFRAGGDDSVRGYSYRSLGPVIDGAVDSGDALFSASVELARPIVTDIPELWGAVFADAGRAAVSFSELRPAVGLGVGLRYRSPVGPLRLDLAWGEETRRLRLHFSVGVTF